MENNKVSGLVLLFSLVMLLVAILLNNKKENNLILSGQKQEIFRASSFNNEIEYQYSS